MDIVEMHTWFRQYAQQMGLQNVRALLPEQIDLLINTSISDYVNQLIRENIGVTNDRIISDNSKIGQINAFKTLYKVATLDVFGENGLFKFDPIDRRIGKISTNNGKQSVPDSLFLVDFSINYRQGQVNCIPRQSNFTNEPIYKLNTEITNFFPIRLIDDAYLADTLNDFILKNRMRSPIMVNYNINSNSKTVNVFDIYIDTFEEIKDNVSLDNITKSYCLKGNLIPYKLRMSYIAKPAKVCYGEDLNIPNHDCDLPISSHIDILKHAVDLYRIAMSGSLHAQQQQEDNQQREDLRNNYRNE